MGVTNFDEIQLDGGVLRDADGVKVVGEQQDSIVVGEAADAAAVRTGVRAILDALRAHGLIASPE